jgi:hypothetical protein
MSKVERERTHKTAFCRVHGLIVAGPIRGRAPSHFGNLMQPQNRESSFLLCRNFMSESHFGHDGAEFGLRSSFGGCCIGASRTPCRSAHARNFS